MYHHERNAIKKRPAINITRSLFKIYSSEEAVFNENYLRNTTFIGERDNTGMAVFLFMFQGDI